MIVGTSGDRKAFQLKQGTSNTAWGSFEFSLGGGIGKPGFAMGDGSAGRDVALYRDEANVWKTPDTFDANAFRQGGDALGFEHLDGALEADQLATDTTLDFTGDTLGVSVQHVIEHSSERIRYVTDASNYSTRGATVMQIFNTGPFTYRVTHINWDLDAPNTGIRAQCRLYTLHDNNTVDEKLGDTAARTFSERGSGHYLYFPEGGILVPPNSRVGVAFSRTDQSSDSACFLHSGAQQANSPERSYNNAQEDWEYLGWGEYEHTDPSPGDGTVSHDTDGNADVYGNANIHYSLVIDHGQIVGDGTVDETHINSENGTEGQVLLANDNDRADWGTAPGTLTAGTAAETQLNSTTNVTVAHGLGAVPDFVEVYVECTTASDDFAVGDRIPTASNANFNNGFGATVDSTNTYLRNFDTTWTVYRKTQGAVDLMEANFKLVAVPYRRSA